MIKELNCNIFDSGADIIIHSCNCFHTMGTGIALKLRNKYPNVYVIDCKTKLGDINKLGHISIANVSGLDNTRFVINCYTQFGYGREQRQVNYEAFYNCLEKVKAWIETNNDILKLNIKLVSVPFRMSCNNAGGDWRIIRPMFDVVFENSNFDVLICKI